MESERKPIFLWALAIVCAVLVLIVLGFAAWAIIPWFSVPIITLVLIGAAFILYNRHLGALSLERQHALIRYQQKRERSSALPLRAKIVEGIPDPVMLLDPERKVVEANRAAKELLGAGITGSHVAMHVRHPDFLEAVNKALKGGESSRFEHTIAKPAERTFTVNVTLVGNNASDQSIPDMNEISDEQEPFFYVLISLHDITQNKLAERMRADFVANASHELRTPLSSLVGFIETLRGSAINDPEAAQRFLEIMSKDAGRMQSLIEDLLSLSRIEQERHLKPTDKVDLEKLIASVGKSVSPALAKRGMTVKFDFPDDIPAVRGDQNQLFQVFQNLIDNAGKYARTDSAVTISAEQVSRLPDRGGGAVIVSIKDEGGGIAPEHIPRLTERFYRVDTVRSRQMGGTGLGLAIVKHIVTRHQGTFSIDSELGVGTTVKIGLPLYTEEKESPDS